MTLSTGWPALDTWLGTMAMVLAMAGVLAWSVWRDLNRHKGSK